MPTLATMQVVITVVAVAAGAISFLLYLLITLNVLNPSSQQQTEDALQTPHTQARNLAVKGLATLSANLVKAGPALWSLIGSALFLLIAAVAAGLLGSAPAFTSSNSTDVQRSSTQNASDAPTNENLPVKR